MAFGDGGDITIRARVEGARRARQELQGLGEGVTGVSDAAERSGSRMARMGDGMAGIGQKMTKGLTLPLVGLGVQAFRTGMNFDASMNKVQALTGATAEEFDTLRAQAIKLGEATVFSASDAADAQSFLAMAGFETTQVLDAMPGMLSLAAAGQMDLARTADIASNILTGFGMEADQMGRAGDVLAATFSTSNTNLEQLGEAMKYVAPVAASAGVEFEEMTAAVGLLGNAGIQGSMAGTSMRNVIARLLDPVPKAAEALERLGVNATDAEGNLLPLNNIVKQLEESGASTADMMTIFGQRAGPAMAALVDQGSDALARQTKIARDSAGEAQRIADTQMQGLVGIWEELKSTFESVMISLYDAGLGDFLQSVGGAITGLLRAFTNLPEGVQRAVVTFAGLLAVMGPLLVVGGKTITMIANTRAGVNALGVALRFLGKNPIILVIAGIAAGLYLLYTRSETFRNAVHALGRAMLAVGRWMADAWDWVRGAAVATWNWITRHWRTIGMVLLGPLAPAVMLIVRHWDSIKAAAVAVWGWLRSAWSAVSGFITGPVASAVGAVVGAFRSMWSAAREVWGWLRGAWQALAGAVAAPFRAAWRVIKPIFDGIESTIGLIQRMLPGGDMDPAQAAVAVDQFSRGVNIGGGGAGAFGGATDGFALGGRVRSRVALVGERGPELVRLPSGSRVTTARETARATGGELVIHVHSHIDGREVAVNTVRHQMAAVARL